VLLHWRALPLVGNAPAMLRATEAALKQALPAFDSLNSLLQQHYGKDAPGVGGIRTVVEEILAFLAVELADRQKPVSPLSMLRKP
jgi:hypothetical protein